MLSWPTWLSALRWPKRVAGFPSFQARSKNRRADQDSGRGELLGIPDSCLHELRRCGRFRLTTQWQGDGKSLDVVNYGQNNKLKLAPTGNKSGQLWKLSRL